MSIECEQGVETTPEFLRLKTELSLWARLQKFPLFATFELTPLCNLRCPMCYVRLDKKGMEKQGRYMSAKEWLEIARQARDMGLLFVTLTGGEPFLHPEFWEIYHGMTSLGLLVAVYSNGLLIDETVIKHFKEDPPHNIKLSLYGASNETYETMCGVKDGFTRVSRALDLLNESGLPFYCTTTIVHENMHDFAAMYRFAAEKQLKFYHTSAVALSARSDLGTPETSRTRTDEIQWTLESMKKEMVKVVDLRPFARCAGVNMTFFLTWHGHLGFCGFSTKPYVQIKFPLDFKSAWEQMLDQVAAIKTPEECQTCEHVEFCRRCPGLLASESGDPEKVSESFCSQAAEKHRIYNELKAKAESTAESECKETPQE